jgi:hypothetical protein
MLDVYAIESDSLVVGRPKGTLDRELTHKMVEFIEIKEAEVETGFHRFCDLTGIDRIHLCLEDIETLAERRRAYNPNQVRVKSAFLATNPLALAIVGLYEALLKSPRIQVRAFASREQAAKWLGVELRKLAL